jgi:predicted signal transduction protein with EAL and GGDEF domain
MTDGRRIFSCTFELAADSMLILDLHGYIKDINPIAYGRLGYTRADTVGKQISSFILPEYAAKLDNRVAIDDFGTGYSLLAYLKKFDIDCLNIDRSFVKNLETDPDNMALSEGIIVMAHKLGLQVIAEGVETEAQRSLLAAAGCDYAQRYLFSKPVPPEEFEGLVIRASPIGAGLVG